MKAVIMAGGEGKRLRPITCTLPKPMAELLNRPTIEYCVELLKKNGLCDITATLHYIPNMIKDYLGDGQKFGVSMHYSIEAEPMGTAGSVRFAVGDYLGEGEEVLVISGDALTDIDLSEAIAAHRQSGASATIVLKKVKTPSEYGVVLKNSEGFITRFLEKPMPNEVFSDLANTGIYILKKEAIGLIPTTGEFDFSRDLFPLMMEKKMPILGYEARGYWCDIGDIKAYLSAQSDLLNGKCEFKSSNMIREGIYIEEGALVSEKAILIPPCYIGSGAQIADNAIIGPDTVIGSLSRIGRNSSIKRCVVTRDARVRENCELRGAIICDGVHIEAGASMFEYAVAGAFSEIGKDVIIEPGVLIWPQKKLEAGERYSENIIWERESAKGIYDPTKGYTDHDLTPERASAIGASFGVVLNGRGGIIVATDGSQQGMMLKHGVMAGALSQGVDVLDMGYSGISQFEYAIRNLSLDGGVYIKTKQDEPHFAQLIICDKYGARLSSNEMRKLERELELGAKRPATAHRLGIAERTYGSIRAYEAELQRRIRLNNIKYNSITVIIAAEANLYDTVARILLPYGFRVRYLQKSNKEKLHNTMIHTGAQLGFYVNDDNVLEETVYEDRLITTDELNAIFLLDNLRSGGRRDIIIPADMPDEFVGLLCENGARAERVPNERSKLIKSYCEKNAYMPELFEPEARILKTAAILAAGKLELYLASLPKIYVSEDETSCSWREVGRILRSLVETENDNDIELVDGIKIRSDKGWILVKPDNDFTACRIIAGSYEQEYAEELCDLYTEKMININEENNKKQTHK